MDRRTVLTAATSGLAGAALFAASAPCQVGGFALDAPAVRYPSRNPKNRVTHLLLLATTLPYLTKTAVNPDAADPRFFEQIRALLLQDFPEWLRENPRPSVLPETSEAIIEWASS